MHNCPKLSKCDSNKVNIYINSRSPFKPHLSFDMVTIKMICDEILKIKRLKFWISIVCIFQASAEKTETRRREMKRAKVLMFV